MTFLLDVNVLISLIDRRHSHHDDAHDWFAREGSLDWATCPITQNGLIRILGRANYPKSPGSPAAAADLLRQICALPGHQFWPDAVSLLDAGLVDMKRMTSSTQVTDSYLLALATLRGGQLATFDRRLSARSVIGGPLALCVIA